MLHPQQAKCCIPNKQINYVINKACLWNQTQNRKEPNTLCSDKPKLTYLNYYSIKLLSRPYMSPLTEVQHPNWSIADSINLETLIRSFLIDTTGKPGNRFRVNNGMDNTEVLIFLTKSTQIWTYNLQKTTNFINSLIKNKMEIEETSD